ncbi:winged helix DNA-binding domain-containing protein [Actinomadura sp. ATCC 31491]|uniref:Winged helix DNA-binding domain-containing protein n=1 Tax=Actinomadura luzonensis TaxID=2805427 RepID=A0ABT0FVH9_9ACTN|nr:winged helix DNA-binding domain-containing protein [Actinomadura luzonensis]MCK2216307.1 winged helix DNA-binding domain-containing protein [Actinomadura luzonensis]
MILDRRVLNRTALDRQLLLDRAAVTPAEAVGRLVALQGQDTGAPYLGLWSRLASFTQDDLAALLRGKQVVRGTLLRGTQHLALADDYVWIRPLLQPVLDRIRRGAFARALSGVDAAECAGLIRAHLARAHRDGRTLTRPQLRDLLLERWPQADPVALAYSAQTLLPIVHTPPNGLWGQGGATPFTLAEQWLERPLEAQPPAGSPAGPAAGPAVERLVRRYLAAFGPASVMDVQAWSGLTRLRPVVEGMRDLRTYRDEDGRVLYDLPGAPLADPGTPAPVRFLPWFDNLMVAYADRSRLMTAEQRKAVCVGAAVYPTFLVDGSVGGVWDLKNGVLTAEPFHPLPGGVMDELAAEGARLMAFAGVEEGRFAWLPPRFPARSASR